MVGKELLSIGSGRIYIFSEIGHLPNENKEVRKGGNEKPNEKVPVLAVYDENKQLV